MEKYLFNQISNSEYLGIVTVLDYEIRLRSYLSELVFPSCFNGKKAIVDMALKTGIDQYRFIAFDVDNDGKAIFETNSYVTVSDDIEKSANNFLKQNKKIVMESFLTEKQKQKILC